jgi:acetyl-CoA carboxylase beta subunit
MEEPVKPTSFTKCSYCGKLTFIDLLDEAMMCEYCREQGRTRPSRRKMHDSRKKLRLHKTAVGNDG